MSENKKRACDRRDGRRIKNMDGVHYIMPHLMPNRCDCEVYIQEKMDVTELLKFVAERNAAPDAPYKTTAFHVFVSAIAKTVVLRPLLNRFIANKFYYERDIVTLSFVAKRKFEDKAEEVLIVAKATGDSVLDDICKRIVGDVHHAREGSNNDMDDTLGFLKKLPRGVMSVVMAAFRFCDRHDLMPAFITNSDINYTTALISNLGSIKCGAPYHHLNNYGTNSIVVTIGEIHKEPVCDKDGNAQMRDLVEFGVTLDERIADGFYFARSVKLLKYIIANPRLLLKPFKEETDYEY